MTTTAIVPIKLRNERVPGKNTALLGGRPLISYCLETLRSIEEIDAVYVYCSDDAITDHLPQGVTFLRRSPSLDADTTNFTQIFAAFRAEVPSDIYVYAHATAPFVTTTSLRAGIDAVASGAHDSAFTAEAIQDFLWSDGAPINFDATNIPRSQDLPLVYRETSGFYIFTDEVFRTLGARVGRCPFIVPVGPREAIDINTPTDVRLAELFLNADI